MRGLEKLPQEDNCFMLQAQLFRLLFLRCTVCGDMHQTVVARGAVELTLALFREFHFSINQGKEGEITSCPHVVTGMPFGSILSYENGSGRHDFSGKAFN